MMEIIELANTLKQTKDDFKQFKKDNEDIFKERTQFNKRINELTKQLQTAMKNAGETKIELDGFSIEITVKKRTAHDVDVLAEYLDDEEKLEAYKNAIAVENENVSIRKKRKTK